MIRREIDTAFTAKVSEYITKGYTFLTNTMGGSQGEIAKVIVRKDTDTICIYLDRTNDWQSGDKIILVVGRWPEPYRGYESETIWLNKLEIVEQVDFFEIERNKFYTTSAEEFEAIREKQRIRSQYRWERTRDRYFDFEKEAKAAVLPFVRRQPKCKTAKSKSIDRVYKRIDQRSGTARYFVKVRGMELRLK